MNQETLQTIISFLTLGGIIFAIFKFFRDPDIKADKTIALLTQQLESERKLADSTIKTMQNCVNTNTQAIENNRDKMNKVENALTRLETIINERIPKRDNSGD